MTAFLLALVLLLSPVQVVEGRCAYYADSWDWGRIAHRQGVTIPAGRVPIARPDCGTLGSTGTLYLGDLVVPFVQVDCGADVDQERLARLNIVGEVPYPVAAQVDGMLTQGLVECRLEVNP